MTRTRRTLILGLTFVSAVMGTMYVERVHRLSLRVLRSRDFKHCSTSRSPSLAVGESLLARLRC